MVLLKPNALVDEKICSQIFFSDARMWMSRENLFQECLCYYVRMLDPIAWVRGYLSKTDIIRQDIVKLENFSPRSGTSLPETKWRLIKHSSTKEDGYAA